MDYWGIMAMEIAESIQDLSAPVLHCSDTNSSVLEPIPTKLNPQIKQLKEIKPEKEKSRK